MKTPILGQAYEARYKVLAADQMINLFPETAPSDAKESAMLSVCPGLRSYAGPVNDYPVRNLYLSSTGKCYAFINSLVYVVESGTFYLTTGSLTTTEGIIAVTDNGTQLMIVDGVNGYILDMTSSVITQITDPDFPNGATVCLYMDSYFLVNVPNSFEFQWSATNDGLSWDALDFASAEGSPDFITAGIVVNREIWWFGPTSKEVFYSTGTDTVFERVAGGFTDQGCTAQRALVQADNTCFWLGQDKNGTAMIYRGRGYTSTRISTHAIEWQMSDYSDVSDCIAWAHQMDGHTFIVFTFPTAEKTWVFDVSTNSWHQRAGFGDDGQFNQYIPVFHVFFEGKHLVGDSTKGRVMEITFDVHDYIGNPRKCLRSWRQPNAEKALQTFPLLEIDCQMGVGISSGQGSDPLLMMRYSNDGGSTFTNERTATLGKIGEYGSLCRFWDCGSARDRVWEISATDPVPFAVVGAYVKAGRVTRA